jgi:uncharacterized protein (DUF427 family)
MPKAVWQGTLLAESEETIVLEGSHYFPPEAVKWEYLHGCGTRKESPWKGQALCFDVVVDHEINEAAAWSFPDPTPAAENIKNYVAFWKGVEIILDSEQAERVQKEDQSRRG